MQRENSRHRGGARAQSCVGRWPSSKSAVFLLILSLEREQERAARHLALDINARFEDASARFRARPAMRHARNFKKGSRFRPVQMKTLISWARMRPCVCKSYGCGGYGALRSLSSERSSWPSQTRATQLSSGLLSSRGYFFSYSSKGNRKERNVYG